jgi:hypothetical protein
VHYQTLLGNSVFKKKGFLNLLTPSSLGYVGSAHTARMQNLSSHTTKQRIIHDAQQLIDNASKQARKRKQASERQATSDLPIVASYL